ncbi:malate:quinone oxidoreductase [Helcobacillus massiliensis]|uniref:malate:quinone oxidoreductase n=1 Tax=Helcobacillus massiliensis TaxID=521392 RepID=UPI0021A63DF6|nr:malate:quinone oxidoreductase [Helcobacillus massiliensis]MCT1558240.1 malate:quinone oxidoreductase [Helcobacillus massiliensis]MCT2035521.1 malate:quinone oxidoreductase [Helcobacillus massiliensis]MCT2331984.1 malate:quinone oxidoreductase [Helcobacillus massiliensis]MDK7742372.1 malate:quinone oxidoreductase [Helcobacillus massiliensis]WOO91992.1 malate:quinone oxidoreductase [Helcobacillus massiliensis]
MPTRSSRTVNASTADAVLIGGGIASATLAALLTELEPDWRIVVLEKLPKVGQEASDGWNNAGTGHSALCELNYTPQDVDGSVSPKKAISINEQFQLSRQFWSHLVETGSIADPSAFIHSVPHISFVRGLENADYLRRRHEALSQNPLFRDMEYTTSHAELSEWAPLITRGRPETESIAATRSLDGTDVNFGELTRILFDAASKQGTEVRTGRTVTSLRRMGRDWGVMSRGTDGDVSVVRAPFVFVGAGGNALPLMQDAGIDEIRGFGGFPISGEWLRCTNPDIVADHSAKVYGKAAVGAPPMSVPHLDTRYINGRRELMFGPYAGWSPKFLKTGSNTDLLRSVKPSNIGQMLAVAPPNLDLMTYLVGELTKTFKQRVASLQEFMPSANADDWELITAGQRVQVIAPDKDRLGVLQFGTQLITTADGSMGGMLGASPGASTSVEIMLRMLEAVFPQRSSTWEPKVRAMVPSWRKPLSQDPSAATASLDRTAEVLGLNR